MLKKLCCISFLVCITFSSFNVKVFAETSAEILPDSARNLPSSGEFSPDIEQSSSSEFSTLSSSCSPLYRFRMRVEDPWFSTAYGFGTSEAFENCDGKISKNNITLVYVKTKLYKSGAFLTSASDTTNHGNYAGIKVETTAASTYGLEAYGEHTFKQEGIMEHNFNTYDSL